MIYLPQYNLAFFHMMKCGGSSIKDWLAPYNGQEIQLNNCHEPIADKAKALGDKFYQTRIFTLIRNPYSKLVSFYTFWRQMSRETSGDTMVAHDNSFPDFVGWYLQIARQDRRDGPYFPKNYLQINNSLSPNLDIIRLEHCAEELPNYVMRYDIPIPYRQYCSNISRRDQPVSTYYTDYLAKQVFQSYQWCFKIGDYALESWKTL